MGYLLCALIVLYVLIVAVRKCYEMIVDKLEDREVLKLNLKCLSDKMLAELGKDNIVESREIFRVLVIQAHAVVPGLQKRIEAEERRKIYLMMHPRENKYWRY